MDENLKKNNLIRVVYGCLSTGDTLSNIFGKKYICHNSLFPHFSALVFKDLHVYFSFSFCYENVKMISSKI